jgi:hypothetical protein
MRVVTCGRATSDGVINIIECGAGGAVDLLALCMRYSRIEHTSFDDIPHHDLRGVTRQRLHDAASEFNPVTVNLHGLLKCLGLKGCLTNHRKQKMYDWAWEEVINMETRPATIEELNPAQASG